VAALETALAAHDIGAAYFALGVAHIMSLTHLVRLTQVFTNFTENGLLVGDTKRHFGWFAELAMFIIQISKKKAFNFYFRSGNLLREPTQGTYGSPNPSLSGHVKLQNIYHLKKGGVRGTVGSLT
jgi:hypothetical protein